MVNEDLKGVVSKLNPNCFSFGFCVYSGGHTLGVTFHAPPQVTNNNLCGKTIFSIYLGLLE